MAKYNVRRLGSYRAYADIEVEADNEDEAVQAAYEVEDTDLNWHLEYIDAEFDGEEVTELPE